MVHSVKYYVVIRKNDTRVQIGINLQDIVNGNNKNGVYSVLTIILLFLFFIL